jgi:hypothetical protein
MRSGRNRLSPVSLTAACRTPGICRNRPAHASGSGRQELRRHSSSASTSRRHHHLRSCGSARIASLWEIHEFERRPPSLSDRVRSSRFALATAMNGGSTGA